MQRTGTGTGDGRIVRRDPASGPGVAGAIIGGVAGGVLGMVALVISLAAYQKQIPDTRPLFISTVEKGLVTRDRDGHSKTRDIARIRTFSFLVRNEGPHPVVVQPELSPDGTAWSPFGELSYAIEPGEEQLFVPQYFLRYARVRFRNQIPGLDSVITVWFQGQS
ncbi:MAG: hypothetical protein IMW93_01950 [Thermoanaerobacteraceae bacterium]|nr:hypothetical protein [Thermoanaerobacteraceae bacterium]